MPANRKCFIHGTVIATAFRTQEGLPLSPTPFVILILKSVFARAQTLYPVIVCHFVIMGNHVHLLLVVQDPGCVGKFVEYVKKESAHSLNRLMGRRQRTVWAKGYDSPIVLDAQATKKHIAYILRNPTRAGLVDRIDDYPNLSSWEALLRGNQTYKAPRIKRSSIRKIEKRTLSFDAQAKIAEELVENNKKDLFTFQVLPNAWMKCFIETENEDPDVINAEIIQLVRDEEDRQRAERTKPVVGAHALRLQSIYTKHEPKKFSLRSICLSSVKELRLAYLRWFREHCASALNQKVLPPGLFSPGGHLRANLNPLFVPTANNVLLA